MTGYSQLTYTAVLLAVFANQLCLPIPSVVFLLMAGAISAHQGMHAGIVVLLSVFACLTADGLWFWFGRGWGPQAVRLLCRFSADPRQCASTAHARFGRYGLPLLCVAKFIPGLDGVMPPLVGAEGVPIPVFLDFDAVGSFFWSAFYVGVGYLLSDQLEIAIGWATHLGIAVGIAIGVPVVFYAGWRVLVLVRMIRQLQTRRISAPMLHRKLQSNTKVAVFDLFNFEDECDSETMDGIPGAFRAEPCRLLKSPPINVPDDVEIILYSSSEHQILIARVAVALKRIGVHRVWVLEGGLKAWRDAGFPVSQSYELPEIVAQRLGVRLPTL